MTTLHLGAKTWVVLNSPRVVSEIISKRSRVTHERSPLPVASDLIGYGKRSVLLPTAKWIEARRVMQHMTKTSAMNTYTEMHDLESVHMLSAYLYRPKEWYTHRYQYPNSVMHRIVPGKGLAKSTPDLAELQRTTNEFLKALGHNFVGFSSQLSKLTRFLQPWRRRNAEIGRVHRKVFESWWRPVKTTIGDGSATPSLVRDALLLENFKYTGDDE